MRRIIRTSAIVLAVLLAGGALLAAHTWYARPLSIDWFFARLHWQDLMADPERMSQQSPLPRWLDDSARRLTPLSPAAKDDALLRARLDLETLHGYDCAAMPAVQRESCAVLDRVLSERIDGDRWRYHDFPVNQLFGVQSAIPSFLAAQHRVRTVGDAEDYVARLHAVPAKIHSLLQSLRERDARDIQPPRFLVDHVIGEMRRLIDGPPASHLLYTSFVDRLDALPPGTLASAERVRLLAQAEAAIAQHVYPAYEELIRHFETIRPRAQHNHGAWSLPDGDAYYAWMVRHHTTTDLSPEQAHQIGLDEVARLSVALDARLRALGLPDGTIGDRLQQLAARPDQRFEDSDAGREAILDVFRHMLDEATQRSAARFDAMPAATLTVERVPPYRERTAPGAYYSPPAADGSRPGTIYVNLRNVEELPRFALRTLAHHEGVPGHHLQTALQQQLEGIPAFRQSLSFSAYAEGWALYAEQLAHEIGLMDDPLDDVGRLQAEMFRAVRLVVDTGLHRKRWTREQAIDYLREKTGLPESDAVAEVERYIVYPGQALSFKVGMLRILMLRERAQQALGERFSLPAFHRAVLGGGRVPLDVLEQRVDAYVREAQAR